MVHNKSVRENILDQLQGKGRQSTQELLYGISPKVNSKPAHSSIKRELGKLVEEGIITKIRRQEYKKHYIDERDGRNTYFIIKQQEQSIITKLLQSLTSKKEWEEYYALNELQARENVQLTTEQLDILVEIILSHDLFNMETPLAAQQLLYDHVVKGFLPSPTMTTELATTFEQRVTKLGLEKYCQDRIYEPLIIILGLLNSNVIIHLLKKMIERKDLREGMFKEWELARVIEEHTDELYDLQRQTKSSHTQSVLYDIRRDAMKNYVLHKNTFERIKEVQKVMYA
jgi:Fe2+ or Zn2+ uptake regulation protein